MVTPLHERGCGILLRMAPAPTRGKAIQIYLVEGKPHGLRVVERKTWGGVLLAFARADVPVARSRPEVQRTGVYVLLGPDPEGQRGRVAYIGEAVDVSTRLRQHEEDPTKDWWTQGYVLTTRDDSLNKAEGLYLEARLVDMAREADQARLENGTTPKGRGLSEADVAEMETYLDEALPFLALMGADIFEPAVEEAAAPAPTGTPASDVGPRGTRLYLSTQLTTAEGQEQSRGFLVFEGALGRKQKKMMMGGYSTARRAPARGDSR